MLNPVRRLARLGAPSLTAGLLAVAGLAQAAPGEAPPAEARLVELKLDLSYRTGDAGTRDTQTARTTLRVRLGERAVLVLNGRPDAPAPDQVAVAIVASDLGDDRIDLRTEVSKGGPANVISRPRLITRNGVQARIEQGRDDPAAREQLSLSITPTLLGPASP